MNNQYSPLRAFTTIGLILTLVVSMSACAVSNEKWKEEVQLSDGKIIIVERDAIYEGGGDEWAFNRSGSKLKEYRIRFTYLDATGQIIEWRTTKLDSQTWPEVPLIFDMESGQPAVFTLVAISLGCEVYSKYVYRNGAWTEEMLPEQFERRTTNLLFGSQKDIPTLVNLEEKRRRNSESGYRQALKQVGPMLKVCG